jgi:hypothetical protein
MVLNGSGWFWMVLDGSADMLSSDEIVLFTVRRHPTSHGWGRFCLVVQRIHDGGRPIGVSPVTRNDDIPQPIYGASSGLVSEGTFVNINATLH